MATDILKALPAVYFDASTLTSSYQVVPSSAFAFPVCMMTIVNDSSKPVVVSFNGTTDASYVRSQSDRPIWPQTNAQPLSQKNVLPAQTQIYVKLASGGSAGTGTIAFEAYYNQP